MVIMVVIICQWCLCVKLVKALLSIVPVLIDVGECVDGYAMELGEYKHFNLNRIDLLNTSIFRIFKVNII